MPVRLWVLVLLAAVFAMHGLQCSTAGPGTGHGTPAAPSAIGHSPAGHSNALVVAPAVGVAAAEAGIPPAPAPEHEAHLWAVCLAVLLSAVTLLGAVALLRRGGTPVVRGSPSSPRRPAARWALLRPPDLSALCLLRI